jgi:hypothetical protein
MRASLRRLPPTVCVVGLFFMAGCAQPPDKELHEAQGAIDAARAAGAEDYAQAELNEAVTALQRGHEAVQQRDYRLALNHALDSRERAQNAAREAADGKASARSAAERRLADVTAALAAARAALAQAEAVRIPRSTLEAPGGHIRAADEAVQEAGEALARGDYRGAARLLEPHAQRLGEAVRALNQAVAERQARPPRRRR